VKRFDDCTAKDIDQNAVYMRQSVIQNWRATDQRGGVNACELAASFQISPRKMV
jgi:hypothetical protein